LTINKFAEIFSEFSKSKYIDLKDELIFLAIRYSRLRVDWKLSSDEERIEMDESRTRCHIAFIDACNILSRNMESSGEEIEWRRKLGNERKVIGDFACYVHYILGIEAA